MALTVSVQFDRVQLEVARATLRNMPGALHRAMIGAVNDTRKKQITSLSRKIRHRVKIKKRDIDPHLNSGMKANRKDPQARITLAESDRLELKYFGAKQTKTGVSYKISTQGKRQKIARAFGPKINKLNNHVVHRMPIAPSGKGTKSGAHLDGIPLVGRLPIFKMDGISPWGTYVKAKLDDEMIPETERALDVAFERRVRLELLRAAGTVKTPGRRVR